MFFQLLFSGELTLQILINMIKMNSVLSIFICILISYFIYALRIIDKEFRPYIKDIAGKKRMFFMGTVSSISKENEQQFDGSATPDLVLVDSEYRDVVWIDVKHPSQWDKTVYDQLNEAWRSSEKIGYYFAEETKTLAANQGLYNGFLAAGLFWSLYTENVNVSLFFIICVCIAALYGAYSTKSKRILIVQGTPAFIALAVLLINMFLV